MIARFCAFVLCSASLAVGSPFDTAGEQTDYEMVGGSVDNRIKFTYKFLSLGKNNDGFMCGNLIVEKAYSKDGKKTKDTYYWCTKEPGKLLVVRTDAPETGADEKTMTYAIKGDRLTFSKFDLLSPPILKQGASKVRPEGELASVKEKNYYAKHTETNAKADAERTKLPWYTPGRTIRYAAQGLQDPGGKGDIELTLEFVSVGRDKDGNMCGEGEEVARYKVDGSEMGGEFFQWKIDKYEEDGEGSDLKTKHIVFSIAKTKRAKKGYVEGNIERSRLEVVPKEEYLELVDGEGNLLHDVPQYLSEEIKDVADFASQKAAMLERNSFLKLVE